LSLYRRRKKKRKRRRTLTRKKNQTMMGMRIWTRKGWIGMIWSEKQPQMIEEEREMMMQRKLAPKRSVVVVKYLCIW
jgi:hypothetical protein